MEMARWDYGVVPRLVVQLTYLEQLTNIIGGGDTSGAVRCLHRVPACFGRHSFARSSNEIAFSCRFNSQRLFVTHSAIRPQTLDFPGRRQTACHPRAPIIVFYIDACADALVTVAGGLEVKAPPVHNCKGWR